MIDFYYNVDNDFILYKMNRNDLLLEQQAAAKGQQATVVDEEGRGSDGRKNAKVRKANGRWEDADGRSWKDWLGDDADDRGRDRCRNDSDLWRKTRELTHGAPVVDSVSIGDAVLFNMDAAAADTAADATSRAASSDSQKNQKLCNEKQKLKNWEERRFLK